MVHHERWGAPGVDGPLSPLLANILLDELDQELERRRHHFVRYADDFIILVKSKRASEQVFSNVRNFLERKQKLSNRSGAYRIEQTCCSLLV